MRLSVVSKLWEFFNEYGYLTSIEIYRNGVLQEE